MQDHTKDRTISRRRLLANGLAVTGLGAMLTGCGRRRRRRRRERRRDLILEGEDQTPTPNTPVATK